MKNELPLEGDIVKCIKFFTYENDCHETFNFIKDDLYRVVDNTFNKIIRIKAGDDYFPFVSDSNIYEGLNFNEYFKIEIKASDIILYEGTKYKPFNKWRTSDFSYTGSNINLLNLENYTINLSLDYLEQVKFNNLVKNIRLNISNLSLDRKISDSKITEFKQKDLILPNKLLSLTVINGEGYNNREIKRHPVILEDIKIPKSLNYINLLNTNVKDLNLINCKYISLKYCNIEKLHINTNTIEHISINDSNIKDINVSIFHDNLNGCGSSIQSLKIDNNTFVTNFSDKRLTLKEFTVFCNTLHLNKTIKHFKLNKIKFNFTNRREDNSTFLFHSNGNEIEIHSYNNEIVLLDLYYLNDKFNLTVTLDSEDNIKIYNDINLFDESEILVLTNNIFNKLAKFSENYLLDENFFDVLFNHPLVSRVKNTGLVNIKEFTFSLLENNEKYKRLETLIFNNGKWYGIGYTKVENYNRYNIDVKYTFLDPSELGFEICSKNIEEGSRWYKPGIEDYYNKLDIYKDNFFLQNNILDYIIYDENKEYDIDCSLDIIHNEKLYIYNNQIFYKGKTNDYVNINKAEQIAKKYNFKLDKHKIIENNGNIYYTSITPLTNQCASEKEAICSYVYEYKNIKKFILNREDNRENIPLLKIGKKIYVKSIHRSDIYILGGEEKSYYREEEIYYKKHEYNIIEILKNNDYKFSYVNLDISSKLRKDIDIFLSTLEPFLNNKCRKSYNRKNSILYYHLTYETSSFKNLLNENYDESIINDSNKKKLKKIQEELLVCFEKTVKRIENGK